jgi:thiomorpholine-carboxylate dehydrogenase
MGNVTQPVRTVISVAEHQGWIGIMPVVYGGLMGAKLVTVYPANAKTNLPTHQAVIQLFSSLTGEPLATMDGRLITEMRTAAVSAIATSLLAPPNARVLAILGSGVQARSHFHALGLVRSFTEVRVWSPTEANAQRFAAETGALSMPTAEAAVRGADVIVTATNAAEPILRGEWLKPDAYVNAMGAVGPAKRELDTAAMQASIVVESRAPALVESGDILLSGASIYAELGELLADPQRPKPAGRFVYKSLGIAMEDLVCAQLVYEALTSLT